MSLQLMTDSACDLSRSYLTANNVEVIPITLNHEEQVFRDGIDIQPEEVYRGMREGKVYKTAQISVQDFIDAFEPFAKSGEKVLHMSFSSGLSGTYNASVIAIEELKEKYPDSQIVSVDTKSASNGLGLIVYQTIQKRDQGATYEELIDFVEERARQTEHIFTVDDLEYLRRGGRLSKGAAMVGNLLNIHPLIRLNDKGELEQFSKVRGRKKLFHEMIRIAKEQSGERIHEIATISHADDEKSAKELEALLKETFGTKEVIISTIGAVIGAHTGPGTLCLYFFKD